MTKPKTRPNILLVYTDQQRYDTLGCCGNHAIRTPNLDRLGESGVVFHRNYVTTPLCVPSRVSLFTGGYALNTSSRNNDVLMAEDKHEFVSVLRGQGYGTALIGKDHCFGRERAARLFDFTRYAEHLHIDESLTDAAPRIRESRRGKMQAALIREPVPADENITGILFDAASEYISRQTEPFFLWLSIPDPHPPYMVPEPYASLYANTPVPAPAWRENEMADKPYRQRLVVEWDRFGREYPGAAVLALRRTYWGMVSCIDDAFGGLMAALERSGQADNTIVVFTSDHGEYLGDHHMLRKGPHLYEALTHVPLIVSWPSHLAPKQTRAMVANIDLFPTLLELAGIGAPDATDGRSFAHVLQHVGDDVHRDFILMNHGTPGEVLKEGGLTPENYARLRDLPNHHLCPEICRGETLSVRGERWKYCMTPGDVDELYDLDSDPNELTNLAADPAFAGPVRIHREILQDWRDGQEPHHLNGTRSRPPAEGV